MSGVLHRLAMRVLPAPGRVRPRLGSRFEGLPGRAEPDVADIASQPAVPIRRASAAPEPMPSPSASAPSARPAVEPPGVEPPLAIGADEPSPVAAEPPHTPVQLPVPMPMRLIDGAADDRGDTFPAAAPSPLASSSAAAARRARRGDRPDTLRQVPLRAPPVAAGDGPGAASARPEALLLPPTPISPTPNPAGEDYRRPEPAPAPPDIQVSIGRIEIRADRHDPRPTRRVAPRASLMSLEDYLGKGRAGR